ncbi:transposase family protein [Clostridium botulinum]|nr:transposase family protein [Clostridium botulinum]
MKLVKNVLSMAIIKSLKLFVKIAAKKVYRLAKELGLLAPYAKHTKQGYLAIAREVTGINELWQIDIKYIKAINGEVIMLTDIIAVYSIKLVDKEITKTATAKDTLITIKRALEENNVT